MPFDQKNNQSSVNFKAALQIRDIRYLIGSVGFFTIASRALVVVIGFQIYQITHSTIALGILGLVEAVPALSLVLIGGWVADHDNRRHILLITLSVSLTCALALAMLSFNQHHVSLIGLYCVIFLAGIARAFADPANSAFEAQVVPKHLTVNGASWIGSVWVSASIIGPGAIGFIFALWGAFGSYLIIATCFALSLLCTWIIGPKPNPPITVKEPLWQSIQSGWRFVFQHQPLLASMGLDLFAVMFSAAIALLPVFAQDILHVGVQGLGIMNATPALGAALMMLFATHRPPMAHAGRNLLLTVTGFGICVLLFAFSRNFYLSLLALLGLGIFDGISMVIRRSMVRLLSPDHMRGRISSVGWIFVCSSNELGTFQSGMMASVFGAAGSVALGGCITLCVVALTAMVAPQLRRLRFDPNTLQRIE